MSWLSLGFCAVQYVVIMSFQWQRVPAKRRNTHLLHSTGIQNKTTKFLFCLNSANNIESTHDSARTESRSRSLSVRVATERFRTEFVKTKENTHFLRSKYIPCKLQLPEIIKRKEQKSQKLDPLPTYPKFPQGAGFVHPSSRPDLPSGLCDAVNFHKIWSAWGQH
jgi:hypothetical protein